MRGVRGLGPVFFLVLACGCGGSDPPAKSAEHETDARESHHGGHAPEVSAEIGALDESKVDRVFTTAINALQACLDDGAKRVEFIGGSVGFFVEVDAHGRLSHAHMEQSSLGDRDTEKCMLDSLKNRSWPAPVGGQTGLAHKSFDFDPPNDVRPPTDWDAERVSETLADKAAEIRSCKKDAPGSYSATIYVRTNGTVLAAGVTPPDDRGEAAVDCLVDVLKHAKFPSPGSWPAKVGFTL
jgi:hypothetical protein